MKIMTKLLCAVALISSLQYQVFANYNDDLNVIKSSRSDKTVVFSGNMQIDLGAGAFSFIKTKQLERVFKDVTGNAAIVALRVLRTLHLHHENIRSSLEQTQRNINQFNIVNMHTSLKPVCPQCENIRKYRKDFEHILGSGTIFDIQGGY